MTEQELIDATNLAHLRIATIIIRDCLPTRPEEKALEAEIRRSLQMWVGTLEQFVKSETD